VEVFGLAVVQDAGGGEMRFAEGWGCAIRRQASDRVKRFELWRSGLPFGALNGQCVAGAAASCFILDQRATFH